LPDPESLHRSGRFSKPHSIVQRNNPPAVSEHDPEKWGPVFGERSCSNNKLERDAL
jgi:hypothetical protein